MRINKFVAQASGLSRRAADAAIAAGSVTINGEPSAIGAQVTSNDVVTLSGQPLHLPDESQTIMLNKPVGYVVSRDGQGAPTVYELLPTDLSALKPIGRLDKDSSGLLLLTTDGELANQLSHPRYAKTKVYEVTLHTALQLTDQRHIHETGVELEDGLSRLDLAVINHDRTVWRVVMREGRNRQIRRTFAALGYKVQQLHRISFGHYELQHLRPGEHRFVQ